MYTTKNAVATIALRWWSSASRTAWTSDTHHRTIGHARVQTRTREQAVPGQGEVGRAPRVQVPPLVLADLVVAGVGARRVGIAVDQSLRVRQIQILHEPVLDGALAYSRVRHHGSDTGFSEASRTQGNEKQQRSGGRHIPLHCVTHRRGAEGLRRAWRALTPWRGLRTAAPWVRTCADSLAVAAMGEVTGGAARRGSSPRSSRPQEESRRLCCASQACSRAFVPSSQPRPLPPAPLPPLPARCASPAWGGGQRCLAPRQPHAGPCGRATPTTNT
eukprot:scaffold479_cov376-Prasinococcus_capsulatus_cf.AAC.7